MAASKKTGAVPKTETKKKEISKKRDEWGILEASYMLSNRDINYQTWIEECFPPWGQYINYQMEHTVVPPNKTALWWFGGPSWGMKVQDEVFLIDNYAGPSMVTRYENSGDCKSTGADRLHWIRINPQVVDIWHLKRVDALFITHHHADHCDIYTVKALLQTTNAKFVGPKMTVAALKNWGVPEKRIIEVKPGDRIKMKHTEVVVEDNYDMNALKTTVGLPKDAAVKFTMGDAAVSYIFNTKAGNIAFLGDAIYDNSFYGVGQRNKVDVTILDMGHNPSGSNDKLTPYDAYRIGKALHTKVLIPDHYDNWCCTYMPPFELETVVRENSKTMKTVILQPGAMFTYPDDKDIGRYKYPDWQERLDWRKARYTLEKV